MCKIWSTWRWTDFSSFSRLRWSTSAGLSLFWAEGHRVSSRVGQFSDGSRASFAGLNTYPEYWKTAFFEGNQKKVCPARNELTFTVLLLYGFPSTDFSGFCVKNVSTWLTVLPAPCFQVRLEVFLSFLHAKLGRERLVYFIVSNHSVLNIYFIKWLGLNLRRTTFDLLVTFSTFKDIDSMFWWLFVLSGTALAISSLMSLSLDSVTRVLVSFHVK